MNEEELAKKLTEEIREIVEKSESVIVLNIIEMLIKMESLNREGRLILLNSMKESFLQESKEKNQLM